METKYMFLIISQCHQEPGGGEGTRVQRHTKGSKAERGLDPRATPGSPGPSLRFVLVPVEVTSLSAQADGKLGPRGPSDLFPCPLCPALSPALLRDRSPWQSWLWPGSVTHLLPTEAGRKRVTAGLRSFDLESAGFTLCQARALRPQTRVVTPPSLAGHTL